jgi:hypothetical protein
MGGEYKWLRIAWSTDFCIGCVELSGSSENRCLENFVFCSRQRKIRNQVQTFRTWENAVRNATLV